jgi:hypothetical protein
MTDTETDTIALNVITPPGIRPEVLRDPDHCKISGRVMCVHDPESLCGGWTRTDAQSWFLVYPVTRQQFIERTIGAIATLSTEDELASLEEWGRTKYN